MLFVEEKVGALTLHLPTSWHQDTDDPHYDDNNNGSIWKNPGRSANKLHKQFTDKLGESSLKHISTAIYIGALHQTHNGFMKRNSAVAQDSQHLIAFTWNDGESPKIKSGTHDTWAKHTGRGGKVHISIGSLIDDKASPSLESSIGESSTTSEVRPIQQEFKMERISSVDSAYSSGSQSEGSSQSCEQLARGSTCNDQISKYPVQLERKRTSSCEIDNKTTHKKIKHTSYMASK